LAEARGAYDVRVFGSVARGEAHPDSDVDLLVKFPSDYRLRDHSGLIVSLEQLLNCPVDVAIEANLREAYRAYILEDAIDL
ncbi:MAG: nucleotidyltransferase domain-containing protein, partial [Anaerolineae bacterium]|nr:nucleotidyltransferase domain-containing protein [Anaerolineae bacterium]